jgi:hypothetical protein
MERLTNHSRVSLIGRSSKVLRISWAILERVIRQNKATSTRGLPSMNRRDQELLDMQFGWLHGSRASGPLALSILTAILLFIWLGCATFA